jgi:predicted PurR-regulated permease PerM
MQNSLNAADEVNFRRKMMSSFIQIAALVILVSYCLAIVGPFISLVIWGIVLAVAIHPLHVKFAAALGGKEKTAAITMIIIGLIVVVVPGWIMTKSVIASITSLAGEMKAGTLVIPPPADKVADWPLIGGRVYAMWSSAASNLGEALQSLDPTPREATQWLVLRIGSLVAGMLQIAASIIIAGVATMYAKSGYKLSCAIASSITPARGQHLADLSIATIRSVTNGVLGVAVIQAVLAGIGLAVMGIPHGGLIAGVVLITAIIQIPALLVLGPVAVWVFSIAAPVPATIFAVYMLLVSLSDNVLKPILLGRGVDLPVVIVLVGAIGGMIQYGVVGLFLGAVILGLGYTIISDWLNMADADAPASADGEAG